VILRFLPIFVVGLIVFSGGCRELTSDRLYALYLDRDPLVADWERALPRTVYVKGGQLNKVEKIGDIDQDTVHTSTASCHHGAALPDPVAVDLRAFYTDNDLFLRLSWKDATRDEAIREWSFDGQEWHSSNAAEDGFGILWDTVGLNDFSCSYACHIDDFGVQGSNFHARNKMKLVTGDSRRFDLWNWKARRTGHFGFADDRMIDANGIHPDASGDIFTPNSHSAARSDDTAFVPGDRPLYDAEGLPIDQQFHVAGSRAPGYLTSRPISGRADVAAFQDYADGRWTVILRRKLQTDDEDDVTFTPDNGRGVAFGLSLMDNTLFEHYASTTAERLVLLPKKR